MMHHPNVPSMLDKQQALLPDVLPGRPESKNSDPQRKALDSTCSSFNLFGPENVPALTPHEILQLRRILQHNHQQLHISSRDETDADSEYSEFPESTHAWAVFADKPQRRATRTDRCVGTSIILFQLFAYFLFVMEAIEDYQKRVVPVFTSHDACQASGEEPDDNFMCEAQETSHFDAAVAFFMLAIFMTPEILQAGRAIQNAPFCTSTMFFASLAGLEVVCAFLSAATAISYNLFIGEVTDAIEVGVGLLFVRELSARAYHGIRHKGVKQYRTFLAMLTALLILGFVVEAFCERTFGNH